MKLSRLLGRHASDEPAATAAEASPPPAPPAAAEPAGLPLELGRDDVAAAEALASAGRLAEAVVALAAANRAERDPRIEVRLVELRRAAASSSAPGPGRPDWPVAYADPFPEVSGALPEIAAEELTAEVLGGAVAHHGCLIVRGLFPPEVVDRCVDAVEQAHRHREQLAAGQPEPGADARAWYRPLATSDPNTGIERGMVASAGGVWLADSPATTAIVLDALGASGVTDLIADHLGETPQISLQKSTLRRSLPDWNLVSWHQDGSFLDPDVRTMNVWVSLSPCGGDRPAPGIEVLPARIDHVLPVDNVMFKHAISYDTVDALAAEVPTSIPEMDPGDAFIFDQLFLHRTYLDPAMTEIRYAIECWFFAPSHTHSGYTPLSV